MIVCRYDESDPYQLKLFIFTFLCTNIFPFYDSFFLLFSFLLEKVFWNFMRIFSPFSRLVTKKYRITLELTVISTWKMKMLSRGKNLKEQISGGKNPFFFWFTSIQTGKLKKLHTNDDKFFPSSSSKLLSSYWQRSRVSKSS